MKRLSKGREQGFSLVEMVVVLAIMAILVGVLAPAYLRYVEKTRKQKDDTAAGEIKHAAEIIVFSGTYTVEDDQVVVTFDKTNGISVPTGDLSGALTANLTELFGDLSKVKPESKTYANKTYKVTIVAPATEGGFPSMTGAWY